MKKPEKVYWLGNAAKSRIISEILEQITHRDNVLIFDFGCGDGGDWPSICVDHPQIRLVGYEPGRQSCEKARNRLKAVDATVYTGNELNGTDIVADFIVSFSVLEHVRDRTAYFNTAKRCLARDGIFYLNYDDGHFRNYLDLNQPRLWLRQLFPWMLTFKSRLFGGIMPPTDYQLPVRPEDVTDLIHETGFRIVRSEYANFAGMKRLFASIPQQKRLDYCKLWLELETQLNADFCECSDECGLSDENLWKEMYSRTLCLIHQVCP